MWISYEPKIDDDNLRVSLSMFMDLLCILLECPVFCFCVINHVETWWTMVTTADVRVMGPVLEVLNGLNEPIKVLLLLPFSYISAFCVLSTRYGKRSFLCFNIVRAVRLAIAGIVWQNTYWKSRRI